jgi:hypothetical protein
MQAAALSLPPPARSEQAAGWREEAARVPDARSHQALNSSIALGSAKGRSLKWAVHQKLSA